MTAAPVAVPVLLGILFLAAGLVTYGRELRTADAPDPLRMVVLGPAFVAAALAAFAGEHFTASASIASIVPKWLPAPLFIAYFVGVAHLAAAVSFVARRYVRLAALLLAIMFALFVLLMDLPGAIAHPGVRIAWSLAARQSTFALGALALFTIEAPAERRQRPLVSVIRVWTAFVLVFYGVENMLYPQYWPGVPDVTAVASWVPLHSLLAIVTGLLLVACGVAMLVERYAVVAAAVAGWWMVLLTLGLFLPQFVVAGGVPEHVVALNFFFDTLLFACMMLVIGRAILESSRRGERAIASVDDKYVSVEQREAVAQPIQNSLAARKAQGFFCSFASTFFSFASAFASSCSWSTMVPVIASTFTSSTPDLPATLMS